MRKLFERVLGVRAQNAHIGSLPYQEQIPIYESYLERHPRDAAAWYDLGLAYKYLLRWHEAVDANERALLLRAKRGDPAWWNLGIAATALRDWERARKAWRGFGLDIDGDEGPIQCNFGMAPVRLPHGEVVWGDRIDPARLIIRNIPLPQSEFRWGDIVLHDGAPNGERTVNGRTLPVFDVLERLMPSEIPTLRSTVHCESEDDSKALIDSFESNSFAAEDWTANVRQLCKACSEGNPGGHNHPFGTTDNTRDFGIAAPQGIAERLLAQWAREKDGRSYSAPAPVDIDLPS